jgi:hypothetical protein
MACHCPYYPNGGDCNNQIEKCKCPIVSGKASHCMGSRIGSVSDFASAETKAAEKKESRSMLPVVRATVLYADSIAEEPRAPAP